MMAQSNQNHQKSVPVCTLQDGPLKDGRLWHLPADSHSYWSQVAPRASTNFALHHSQDALVCVVSEDLPTPAQQKGPGDAH